MIATAATIAATVTAQHGRHGVTAEPTSDGLTVRTPAGKWALLDRVTATIRTSNTERRTNGLPPVKVTLLPL